MNIASLAITKLPCIDIFEFIKVIRNLKVRVDKWRELLGHVMVTKGGRTLSKELLRILH